MRIELDAVRHEARSFSETVPVPLKELAWPDVSACGPVDCHGVLTFVDPGFHWKATLSYSQVLQCTRCLEPMTEEIESGFELLVLVGQAEAPPPEKELSAEDLSILLLPDESLETVPLILEQVQLNLPMKPLCEASCPGLCIRCGHRLGAGTECRCEEELVDSPFKALAGLRHRLAVVEGEENTDAEE